ncbi:hypothetical protein BXU10_16285 [Flavobacterium sp. LM4]|nr:hypothetical protein BXU10_16285 [Flavobacterium sp. LM4]
MLPNFSVTQIKKGHQIFISDTLYLKVKMISLHLMKTFTQCKSNCYQLLNNSYKNYNAAQNILSNTAMNNVKYLD